MTLVGFFGILLALSAVLIADLQRDRRRIGVFALLLIMHTFLCTIYYAFAVESGSDAHLYYNDPGQWRGARGLGTVFLINFTQFLRDAIGGTFFDYFLLYNAVGFWGLVIMMRISQEIFQEMNVREPTLIYLTLFLPGLHFWTSALGKDAPLFFAISLAVWSMMRLTSRYVALGIAVAIMLLYRPHIALLTLVAVAIAVLTDKKTRWGIKVALVAVAAVGVSYVASDLQTTYRFDATNADSVADFVAERSNISEESGGDAVLMNAGLPLRIMSLWARPFFFDADAVLAYVASMENTVIVLMMAIILLSFPTTWMIGRRVIYVRFCALLFGAITLLIASINFNVGLGLRQKMMAMPCLLTIFYALIAVRMAQANHRAALVQPAAPAPVALQWRPDTARVMAPRP